MNKTVNLTAKRIAPKKAIVAKWIYITFLRVIGSSIRKEKKTE
jgi:hypothetical protein